MGDEWLAERDYVIEKGDVLAWAMVLFQCIWMCVFVSLCYSMYVGFPNLPEAYLENWIRVGQEESFAGCLLFYSFFESAITMYGGKCPYLRADRPNRQSAWEDSRLLVPC